MSRNNKAPTPVENPMYPVKQGSVLSRLLESTNVSSSRCPAIISGYVGDEANNERWRKSAPSSNAKLSNKPRSKIPTKCKPTLQGKAFEKSLRQYASSAPGTPTSLSRASSPARSTRVPSPSNSKIASLKEMKSNRPSSMGRAAQSRPPPSPRGHQQNLDSPSSNTKPVPYEPKPVRLAYGIYGPQYKANQKMAADLAANNSQFCRSQGKPCSGGFIPGERMTRKLVTNAENQHSNRMLPTQKVAEIDRMPIQTCTPLLGEDGVIIGPCQHEEKACQAISAEMLFRKRNVEKADLEEKVQCRMCDELRSILKKRDEKCQKFQGTINELRKSLEDLSTRHEMLELQLFENKETFVGKKDVNDDLVTFMSPIVTVDAGVETDKDMFHSQLKFSLETFLLSQISSCPNGQEKTGGDSVKIDENNNDPLKSDYSMELKMTQMTLAVRDALLNEIRRKLKKGYKILQERCEPLLINPSNADESQALLLPRYQEITPPEIGKVFHSYRKFLRFIHTFVEQSLGEVIEFDHDVFNLDPNDFLLEIEKQRNKNKDISVGECEFQNDEVSEKTQNEHDSKLDDDGPKCSREPYSPQTLVLFLSSNQEDLDLDSGSCDQNQTDVTQPNETEDVDMNLCENSPTVGTDPPVASSEHSEPRPEVSEDNNAIATESSSNKNVERNPRLSVVDWFTAPEEKVESKPKVVPFVGESPNKTSPLAAAKLWLDRTPSPLTNFILNPISFTKLFDPLYDPVSVSLNPREELRDPIPMGESGTPDPELQITPLPFSEDVQNFNLE